MLALSGIYQNGTIIFERHLPINKTMKVIVTFVDEEFSECDKIIENFLTNKADTTKKSLDINKFSFLQSIEATKDFQCSFSDASIEER